MKRLKKCLLIAGIIATSGYGVSRSVNDDACFEELVLVNVEALAQDEGDNSGDCKPVSSGDVVLNMKKKFFSKDCKDKEDSSCDPNAPSVFNQIVDPIVKIIPLLK